MEHQGIEGVSKFLRKLWRLFHDANGNLAISDDKATKDELKSLKEFWENKEFNVVFISATEKLGIQNLKKELFMYHRLMLQQNTCVFIPLKSLDLVNLDFIQYK